MTTWVTVILLILALPATVACLYLLAMTLLSQASPPPPRSSRQLRFDVIVPAHDEVTGIAGVVTNLRALDWPADAFRVIVVADNCTDDTATVARAAGAHVLERRDTSLRGKGHALELAFQLSLARGWAGAVVVIDADSRASPNLLEAFAARIENGAEAIQVHYRVLNADASWRTRLLSIALAAFHRVRSRARERLRLSCGIRGNGWCITHRLLHQVPHRAHSLVEDVEYGIELGLAGFRVQYVDEADVAATMVSGERAARTQRQRWEGGRLQLIRTKALPLLRAAAEPGSLVCLDLALDLLMPPLSYVAVNVLALIGVAGILMPWFPATFPWLCLGIGCAACLSIYVGRGWQLSGIGPRGILDLARAPFFVLWKLLLMLGPRDATAWVRTRREDT